ncbi:hypothetical protein [Spiroplasma poulsonii]|uniref:Uncharacterized protein n=1 Tax=Spiroplasma poulsonii TaxID=2138 RepID=A0A2P6F9N3_9MOLU|nr:hypothetical protein [Spiroplasma poulsonii]PQM30163.1 hypothetical protein SMSRO_SF026350 [Spiroplasma poulsonii]
MMLINVEYLNQYKLSYFMNNDNKADNFYTKEVKVGKYWDAYMIDDRSSIQFGEAKFEQVFTQQSTERQYTLLILDEDAEKLNINDYYNFYTAFNDRDKILVVVILILHHKIDNDYILQMLLIIILHEMVVSYDKKLPFQVLMTKLVRVFISATIY